MKEISRISIERFLEIERKYGLNQKNQMGIHYWTLFRFSLWNYSICSEKLGLAEPYNKVKKYSRKKLKMIWNGLRYPFEGKKHRLLVLSHPRRTKEGDEYECLYTDEWVKSRYDAFFLERAFQCEHLIPVSSELIIYNDRVVLGAELFCRLYKIALRRKYLKLIEAINREISQALNELTQVFDWKRDHEEVIRLLADLSIKASYQKKRYRKLLSQIRPEIIVEVVGYDRMCMLINSLAKEMNIPTIELQHGTMYREHAAYQYSEGEVIPEFPDKVLLFSDYWKNLISVPISRENLIPVGFPHFERKRQLFNNYQRKDKRTTLIFLSQGTIGKYLGELAVKTMSLLSQDQYRIIYKLHPSEYSTWKENLGLLDGTGIEVIDSNSIDLYQLFAQSDYQIGAYSTALFEGLGFGLTTFIYKVGHYDIMQPLADQGFATLVNNEDELVSHLNDSKCICSKKDLFWKDNSVNNICKEIDRYLKK